jgi:AcrR family transcriptional regulator
MENDAVTGRVMGRPRGGRDDRAIAVAALELMAEQEVHEFRMDDVAERAGVGKATIYRRYRSKEELVTAAVATLVGEIAIPDTGSTRADLLTLLREAVDVYNGRVAAGAMPSLVAAMHRSPELARAVRDGFLAGRRRALQEVLSAASNAAIARRARSRAGARRARRPLFYRLLITGGPIDQQLAERVAELMLRGFASDEPRRRKPRRARKEKAE